VKPHDGGHDPLVALHAVKASKMEEVKKLNAALESARSRGEALARELANARQECDRLVCVPACVCVCLRVCVCCITGGACTTALVLLRCC
jgi:hypothetical protein